MEPGHGSHQIHPGAGKGIPWFHLRAGSGKISEEVRTAAYKIIEAKNATYYGIGMALTRITKAVLGNENSVMTVSAMLRGEYGQNGVFVGVPCIINQNGIQRVLPLSLEEGELEKLNSSCEVLKESYHALGMD